MDKIRFIIYLLIAIILFGIGNYKWGSLPPLGKFFNPFYGFYQNGKTANIKLPETLHLNGLSDEVEIFYDHRMVPHIQAKNTKDLYYAQGYVTAHDRLWQMELQTKVAEGTLAEIFGSSLLKTDRENRRMGLGYAAEKSDEYLRNDVDSYSYLQAYADGVNAYIATLDKENLPLEYKLLDYGPKEWTPLQTILLLKYMSKRLGSEDRDLSNSNAIQLMGIDLFNKLYKRFLPGDSPIIPSEKDSLYEETPANELEAAWNIDGYFDNFELDTDKYMEGSNNWAVGPEKSASGNPILCNDPHLALSLPAIWYEIHLMTPTMNVYGASIPGAPMVTIGFNDSIAWGVTNASRDVRDYYKLKFQDNSFKKYFFDGEWKDVEYRIEEIKVRGSKTFIDTVRYTVHGPILYDHNFEINNSNAEIAMSWTALQPSNELLTFYKLNVAQNYEDYLDALVHYQCPAQNFIFASTRGDIAIKQQGKFPIYKGEEGRFIQDGQQAANIWTQYIPTEKNPMILNPKRGFVSSANQHPTDDEYEYAYDGHFEYYRNRRINEVLSQSEQITMKDMGQLQNDNYNLLAADILPFLLSTVSIEELDNSQRRYYDELKKWNYINDPSLVGPAIFEEWWKRFYHIFWEKLLTFEHKIEPPSDYPTTLLLLNMDKVAKIENKDLFPQSIEKIKTISTQTIKYSIDQLKAWEKANGQLTWAKYKGTKINHLAKIPGLGTDVLNVGGNLGIVNAISKDAGPSWRMIIELDKDKVKAKCIYPGGQSGNPASPYYDNFINDWIEGKYYDVLFTKDYNELMNKSNKKQLMLPQ